MKTIRTALVLAVSLAFASVASAQTTTRGGDETKFDYGDRDNGIYAATLLQMAISPRSVALGQALGAIEGDPSGIWFNAAGIARMKTNSFFVTGAQRFGETQLAGAAVTFPTTLGTFGIAARAFNAGTIEVTEDFNLVGGRERAYQLALEGGGAIQLARHWLWGGTLFYAQETLGNDNRGTVGINSGMMFPDIFRRLTLGIGVRNWGTEVTFEELGFRPPLMGYLSGAWDVFRRRNLIQTPLLFRGQALVVDAKVVGQIEMWDQKEDPFTRDMIGALGAEATVNGVAIGRIGYRLGDDNERGLSLGAGINVGQFRLEYAFRDRRNAKTGFFENDPIGDEHHVAAAYFWGGAEANQPVVPVIITQPVDTAAINAAVRAAIERSLAELRPLLDSLRSAQVEVSQESDLTARYIVPVHFEFDSATVRDTDLAVLGQVAEVIRRVYPSAVVTIEGFADPAGTAQYNLALSRRRAEAVRDVMVSRFGLPAQQFRTVGYGEQPVRLVAPGARRADPGAQLNRRVAFTIDATQRF
ncbi:MAG TPA: PorV/PorQ family protein [Gemmatimonadaceae bacterium]|nr:PorV/PorQ family protein [Gemmatimonadaceae bacterium]